MTTKQTAPVTDEELDQMIWKLERDGMTPKMLSLMRELLEVRRAKSEPVARELQEHRKAVATPIYQLFDMGWYDTNKQTHDNAVSAGCAGRIVYTAPPAPVVPDLKELEDILDWILMLPCPTPKATHFAMRLAVVIEACRAAMQSDGTLTNEDTMLSSGNSEQLEPVSNRDELNSPVTPDGWIPVSERMPDPKSELRVCVYTPNPHEDIRYRFVPASLFKAVCRDATHWHYMSAPKEVG